MKLISVLLIVFAFVFSTPVYADEHLDLAIKNLESEINLQEEKLAALKASYAELKALAGQPVSKTEAKQAKAEKSDGDKAVKKDWKDRLPQDTHY